MIVTEESTARTSNNTLVAWTAQYEVPVIDSSRSYHGSGNMHHPNRYTIWWSDDFSRTAARQQAHEASAGNEPQ